MSSERARRVFPPGATAPNNERPAAEGRRRWPREARLLKRSEFEQVYSQGRRQSSPFFLAYLLRTESPGCRVGFTTPRALGNAARRNRIKRRLREAVRLHLPEIGPGWRIVFHPRVAVLETDFARLESEVCRLFASLRTAEAKP